MGKLTKERKKELIKDALEFVNEFPMIINEKTDKVPNYLKTISLHPEIIFQIFADISFKLYVLHHTETDEDIKKLDHFFMIMDDMKHLLETKDRQYFSLILMQLKMAYPIIDNDTVLADLENELWQLRFKTGAADITAFFSYAMRINNYLACSAIAAQQFFQHFAAHQAKYIENQESWEYIGPIFKACAAQIKPEFNVDQRGEVFSRFFYGPGDGKLEGQLKKHGEWDQKNGEKDTPARIRIRKRYLKDFNSWMERKKNANHELEKIMLELLEKTFWCKKSPEQLLGAILNQFAKTNTASNDISEIFKQLQEFAKGIKLE